MTPTINKIVRLKSKMLTGVVTEVGCDKCIVKIDNRSYECDFSELTEPIVLSTQNQVKKVLEWLIETNYRFFEDESGNGSVKIAGSAIVGALSTALLSWIINQ